MGTNWLALPVWTIPLALATWIAKDVLLYPVLKTAYEGDKPVGQASMVGSLGTATEDLRPRGYVKIGPELWRAECSEAVRAGDAVRVKGCHGMTMLVEPVESETGRSR